MPDEREYLTKEEAARIWKRAAQLQADDDTEAESRGAREAARHLEGPALGGEGYSLAHVRSAAVEAGIGADFIEAALADVRAERAFPVRAPGFGGRLARAILGRPEDVVAVRRVVEASVEDVIAALEVVLPAAPYNLTLRDGHGDPRAGGVLVFDILGASFTGQGSGGFAGEASWADFRQVLVSLRDLQADPGRVEVTLRAPVAWAFGVNAGFCGLFAVLGGGLGLGLGSAGGAGVAAVAAVLGLAGGAVGALVALVVAGGAVGGGLAATKLYRTIYRYAVAKGRRALEGLLAAVAAQARGGWGLLPPSGASPSRAESPPAPPALPGPA